MSLISFIVHLVPHWVITLIDAIVSRRSWVFWQCCLNILTLQQTWVTDIWHPDLPSLGLWIWPQWVSSFPFYSNNSLLSLQFTYNCTVSVALVWHLYRIFLLNHAHSCIFILFNIEYSWLSITLWDMVCIFSHVINFILISTISAKIQSDGVIYYLITWHGMYAVIRLYPFVAGSIL